MARIPRVVIPGFPHHITQRGNRRQQTFFTEQDYRYYIQVVCGFCAEHGVEIWAYCLMPNHVHLIAVPRTEDSLRLAIGRAHQSYTRMINSRHRWKGYLWQGRFASFVMDEPYLLAAARYIELNPVRAALTKQPQDYPWSSARAHIIGRDDRLVKVSPLLALVNNWREYLDEDMPDQNFSELRNHQRTGRPLGGKEFVTQIEALTGRVLRKSKPGPEGKSPR